MATKIKIDSRLCSNETIVTATLSDPSASLMDKRIKITAESTCPKIRDFIGHLAELSVMDIMKSQIGNPILIEASKNHVTPDCLVPTGAILASWAEAGMVSKTLLASSGPQCISLHVDKDGKV